jgi:hypothetical protein
MFRAIFTLLAFVSLAGGFIAAVMDGVRSLGAGRLVFSSTADVLLPRFPNIPILLYKAHPWLWDPVGNQLMRLPICVCLGGLGVVLFLLMRRRSRKTSFE